MWQEYEGDQWVLIQSEEKKECKGSFNRIPTEMNKEIEWDTTKKNMKYADNKVITNKFPLDKYHYSCILFMM